MKTATIIVLFAIWPLLSWAQFELVEDFETGFTAGTTIDGINGWDAATPVRALSELDPLMSGRGLVAKSIRGGPDEIFKVLGNGQQITEGSIGTLFFEVYFSNANMGDADINIGLSDDDSPDGYDDFEAQLRFLDDELLVRDGSGYVTPLYDFDSGVWMRVWMVVDNDIDEIDVYVESPSGETGQVLIGEDGDFRVGTHSALESFLLIQKPGQDIYFDNIYIDPISANLQNPIPPIPGPEPNDDLIEVGVGGALSFDPLTNDTGNVEESSLAIGSPPMHGTAFVDPASGKVVYKHTGLTSGSDSFEYSVENFDGSLVESAEVAVVISGNLRLENTTVEVPLLPPGLPVSELILEDGLPGLTFKDAVAMTGIPGQPNALLIASIEGSVWYVPDTTVAVPEKHEVLDVSSLSNFTRGRSIYSLTCFPDFATSGHVIINYQGDASRLPVPGPGETINDVIPNLDEDGVTSSSFTTDLRVSRFTLSAAHLADVVNDGMSASENQAVLDTEFPYINLCEQGAIHTINDCKFGPDGYLHVSFGDEGGQGDPYRNGQKLTKDYFSSIIRIDVDPASINPKPNPYYAIAASGLTGGQFTAFSDAVTQDPNFRVPADNPFIHTSLGGSWSGDLNGVDLSAQLGEVRTEIWAFGLRNPFKFHLDVEDGTGETEAWVGDVGKDDRDEVSLLKKGENAGWSYYEGDIEAPGISHAPQPAGATPHKSPLYSYDYGQGDRSVTGGVFYRGSVLSEFTNKYVFGDYASGRIWTLERDGTRTEFSNLRLAGNDLVDFEFDAATGELFLLEHGSSGRVMRITRQITDPNPSGYPEELSEVGLFADLTDLSPNTGVVPYDINLRFWSDGADKRRWFVIKNLTDTVGYSQDENWNFPEGMVWVKHFDFDLDQEHPGTEVKRLETRLLVRNATGAYGVSYRWNELGTEAFLADNEGEEFEITFTDEEGDDESFAWRIPSRAECMTCHTTPAGYALSSNTRQFNLEQTIHGQTGNLLNLLSSGGYLSGFTDDPMTLPRHFRPEETTENLEERVRSYLAVNCAYCHQSGGSVPGSWDGRANLTIEQTNLLYGALVSEGAPDFSDHIIRPGDLVHSAIWNKINAREAINGTVNGYSQMPPIGSNRLDEEGIELIREWIENYANKAPSPPSSLAIDAAEGSAIGASLGLVGALDPDVRDLVSDQSQLSYEILSGNEDGFFSLDSSTGEITVTGWLDFEQSVGESLQIRVQDHFAPNPKSVDFPFSINVLDTLSEDANSNGLPDAWENAKGLTGAPKGGDQDQDRVLDFFELMTGGDPQDPSTPGMETVTVSPVSSPAGMTFSWRCMKGFDAGSDYLIQGGDDLSGWNDLVETVDYEVVSDIPDGVGYRRMTVRLLNALPGSQFLRLSAP